MEDGRNYQLSKSLSDEMTLMKPFMDDYIRKRFGYRNKS